MTASRSKNERGTTLRRTAWVRILSANRRATSRALAMFGRGFAAGTRSPSWPGSVRLGQDVLDAHAERGGQRAELAQADVLAAGLDVGDRRPADPRALGESQLRETASRAQRAHALPDAAANGAELEQQNGIHGIASFRRVVVRVSAMWSGRRESNPGLPVGSRRHCHYATPANAASCPSVDHHDPGLRARRSTTAPADRAARREHAVLVPVVLPARVDH